ncbi:MAG: aconitate hydratase AcnA [Acidobacteria bacterium]|nr:aconitate hydratase AcnA [Acidobacteriota bacterium]MDW7983945.1 aconitate hydratase AcnA [Acidobacteriota bacterium]
MTGRPYGFPEAVRWLDTPDGRLRIYSLHSLEEAGLADIQRLPYSIRILLENLLRHYDGEVARWDDVVALARWRPGDVPSIEIPFRPQRVLLQDFTGVPCIADLAAMRAAVRRLGGDPRQVNPRVPVDLVIDHSVQVDFFGSVYAFEQNVAMEYERNRERYAFLRWAQRAFRNFRVVPPGTGIVHQVNLEYLASVVQTRTASDGIPEAFPDTLVGTDSHTTMINGLGILGWGVGGIEAEAVMLGQPIYMLVPEVVGVRLTGELPEGATATDLVLMVTYLLRKKGVVGKFVEFFGPGIQSLRVEDRATIANMAPECGSTVNLFPVDDATLEYLRGTGRDPRHVERVERYMKAQGLFWTPNTPEPLYSDVVELDLSTVEPTVAGPRRPHDRVPLRIARQAFREALRTFLPADGAVADVDELMGHRIEVSLDGLKTAVGHGSVVIAAITSCTNTSNPSVMVGAGLLAKKAVERGLTVPPHVKTSLAPGSRVVTDYLVDAGLLPYLQALRFHIVGYGCTTCIGNSGPLPDPVARAIEENGLVTVAVLSGNRNFEGRINPHVRASYLMSPPLVVAYALAGTMDIDVLNDPLGWDPNGRPVYLRDLWPTHEEVQALMRRVLNPRVFRRRYTQVFRGDARWRALPVPRGDLYRWDPTSTYIQEPPFFRDLPLEPPSPQDIRGARVLVLLGDSITTDHISPAGAIPEKSPAGQYLIAHGVPPSEFNTYGTRRGNHEVMIRGTFANIRLRNLLRVPDDARSLPEGGWTVYFPTGEVMTVYDAAMRYRADGTPLIVIAGKEYGSGSSRDWAAKGTFLLGIRAVLAESFERIHRSNLVGMGVLPLEFEPGQSRETLGLTGHEIYHIEGIAEGLQPRSRLRVRAVRPDGTAQTFTAIVRLDTPVEVTYYRHGGILPYVLREILNRPVGR